MIPLVLFWGIVAFLICVFLTKQVRQLALTWNVVDVPDTERRHHKHPTPLLGGVGIWLTLVIVLVCLLARTSLLTSGGVSLMPYLGFLIGGGVLILGGWLDDRYRLPPMMSIVAPLIAAVCVIVFGINIEKLTNPLGGVVFLEAWQSNVLVFVWLMVMMYTTKFLDGIDGLATSISSVAACMMMLLALSVAYFQPDVAVFAAVVLGAFLGFFVWNRPPALLFLGEGGSTLIGFTIGVLAVISGAKLAIALLVLAIPLFDLGWTIMRRWYRGGIRAITVGDRGHVHHRLQDLGWPAWLIVSLYTMCATLVGLSALFLQSGQKVIAFISLLIFIAFIVLYVCLKQTQTPS